MWKSYSRTLWSGLMFGICAVAYLLTHSHWGALYFAIAAVIFLGRGLYLYIQYLKPEKTKNEES